jgi:hypothetical protein
LSEDALGINVQGSPRIKHIREWGSISAPIPHSLENLKLAPKEGTNMWPSGVTESHKNTLWGTALEGGYISRCGLNGYI